MIVGEGQADGYAASLLKDLIIKTVPERATVLTLDGDLGAGKTTLVQALARELGVTEVVTSPTFVVMKTYATSHGDFTQLVHIDAYRIDDVSELGPLNFMQVLASPQTLICIEWPERIAEALPKKLYAVSLVAHPDGTRTISYHDY